jgi:hypothetical protein
VVEVHTGIRRPLTADVCYRAMETGREGLVQLDSTYSDIKAGDPITVIYGPG